MLDTCAFIVILFFYDQVSKLNRCAKATFQHNFPCENGRKKHKLPLIFFFFFLEWKLQTHHIAVLFPMFKNTTREEQRHLSQSA